MKTNTGTSMCIKPNSVKEMLNTLMQADQNSIVSNENGNPVSAWLDVARMRVVIVEEPKTK